ncbi:pyridoxal-phosphate dependent enzyme [Nonomuraea africana]|uniref:pyridoxal-phosphate dependent enzyme n=1 Tax=Nonomuraea africana TaxID=46171 RepID=UPI00340B1A94
MEAFGACVTLAGADGSAARAAAAAYAADHSDVVFIRDGLQPAVAEGAGTIGVELAAGQTFDAIVLPVGDGALISGVARWIKAYSPTTRIVGVNAAGAPSMLRSLEAGHAVAIDKIHTFAEGISVRTPIEESVQRARKLVDEMVLVTDEAIAAAMERVARTLGVLLEPAGAAGLAAIATGQVAGERLATVLTGANPRPEQLRELVTRLAH